MRRTALAVTATALLAAACATPASKDLGSLSKSATITTVMALPAEVQRAAPANADFPDLGQRLNPPAVPLAPVHPAPLAPRGGSQLSPARPPAADPCNRPTPAGRPGIMLPACATG